MTPTQFIEMNIISELVKQGFDINVAQIGAREALKFYTRAGSCCGKSKMFDECLYVAKAWAIKSQSKKKNTLPSRPKPAGPPSGVPCPRGGGPAENG